MPSLEKIIEQAINPFDPVTFRPGNFWQEKPNTTLTVESIHQEVIVEIEALLDLVTKDCRSRTVLLLGESGSGKSHLLGRLKRTLNPRAFFAYIGPWADSEYIWRHTLRYTVDSLMQIPEGQQESQLLLWLKGLSAFTKRNLKQRIFDDSVWNLLQTDRQKFIKHLKQSYKKASIYNSEVFFGILRDLTDPNLYELACEWLRGDNLSEESMQSLNVKYCIESEEVAKSILTNLGKISTETQPIVLCFDNLDVIPRLIDGFIDLQSLFNLNTSIHNDSIDNFLIIISVITNTWKQSSNRIQTGDKARVDQSIQLKPINLDQAEALWADRLQPLHRQAESKPDTWIYPLERSSLEESFPGGKTKPRNVLMLGRKLFQEIKPPPPPSGSCPEFYLLWQSEFKKIQKRISRITLLSAPELIRMLQTALTTLEVKNVKLKLLTGKFSSYSLSYQKPGVKGAGQRVGVVWTEDPGMKPFYDVMSACQRAIDKDLCQNLRLIRSAGVGNSKLVGNQIYRQIFVGGTRSHIKSDLTSIHFLATYYNLVASVLAKELIVGGKSISLQELEALVRECKIFQGCRLLKELEIITETSSTPNTAKSNVVKDYLLNLVKTQHFMGRKILADHTHMQFPQESNSEIEKLIDHLCQENKVKVVNPEAKPEEQTVCLVI